MTVDLLDTAREALIAGRPEDALAAMTRFHELGPLHDPAAIRKAQQLLEELAVLAEAGRQGVAVARQGLAGAVELASGVATYDSHGQRAHAGTDRRRPMRF